MRAFVFPGQGAQTIGMGQALADAYPAARAVFDEVDDALGEKLSDLIWSGEIAELTLTKNAQPALMATSLAAMRALEAEGVGIDAASFVAGHSLGEYSALAASGALSIADTARLLRIRGEAMQAAVPVGIGAMAVLLGMDFAAAQAVAAEAAHPDACVLPDFYHIYKGGSSFEGLSMIEASKIHVFHMNDYPAEPDRTEMNDSHRVYPGDGVAPLTDILNMIGGRQRSVTLSLELFNKEYWKQDALYVAKTGLAKMKAAVAKAG